MDDYNQYEEEGRYAPPKPQTGYGSPGYTGPQGPYPTGYDPGPNWNGGVAPAPSDPYQNYNGGSPVDAPLQAGHGWEWSGPVGLAGQTEPMWGGHDWQYGRWNQVAGRGLGYQAQNTNTGGGGTPPPGGGGGGAVPPIQPKPINVPGSTLPGDIQANFDKVPAKTPIQSAYQDALLKYMSRSQETPNLNDPILGPQSEVYRVQQQRNQERNRRGAVERAAASGLGSSGALDRKIEQGRQQQNFNTAQYNANLVGGELDKRRQELLAALQLASATGDAEAARELQSRLAQISAQMQQQGLNLQGQLGQGDLSLRLMQTLLGNDQFYDSLGINTALSLEGLNQNALRSFFGGGF